MAKRKKKKPARRRAALPKKSTDAQGGRIGSVKSIDAILAGVPEDSERASLWVVADSRALGPPGESVPPEVTREQIECARKLMRSENTDDMARGVRLLNKIQSTQNSLQRNERELQQCAMHSRTQENIGIRDANAQSANNEEGVSNEQMSIIVSKIKEVAREIVIEEFGGSDGV